MAERRFASLGGLVCAAAACFGPVGGASAGGGIIWFEDFESPPFVAGPLGGQGGWTVPPIVAPSLVTLAPFAGAQPGFDFGSLTMRVQASTSVNSITDLARSPLLPPHFGEVLMDVHIGASNTGTDIFRIRPVDSQVAGVAFTTVNIVPSQFLEVLQQTGLVQTSRLVVAGETFRLGIRMGSDGVLGVRVNGELIFTGVTAPFALNLPSNGFDRLDIDDRSPFGGGADSTIFIDNIVFDAEPPGCPADFSGDGVVGAADLSSLLGSWGPCPQGTPASTEIVFFDDFSTNQGWISGAPGDTSGMNGSWVRAAPFMSMSQPGQDTTPGVETMCYITGASGSGGGGGMGGPNMTDVDGTRTLTSPPFDATAATASEAFIDCQLWFSTSGGGGSMDALRVLLSGDDGATWTEIEAMTTGESQWRPRTYRVRDFLEPTSTMRLRVVAEDFGSDDLVDAAIDDVRVRIETGAVETPPCPADLSGDGVVGAADLSSLLGSWGPCAG